MHERQTEKRWKLTAKRSEVSSSKMPINLDISIYNWYNCHIKTQKETVTVMAFLKNEAQQITLTDSYTSLSEREKGFLKKSWANDFADNVFPHINEDRFSVLYSANDASRPNTPVNVVIGSFLLKEMLGQTDEELLESILFDVRYQYALHTTSCKEQPVSDRTFSRFRERVLQYEEETGIDLLKEEMYSLADCFCDFLEMNKSMKRVDSIMVSANCKNMSRLELFYSCIEAMVRLIDRTGETGLLKGFERYLQDENKNITIYRCKPEESKSRLEKAVSDAVALKTVCKGYEEFSEYQNLKRLIEEQIVVRQDKIELQETVAANSLQNPSDPDATFRTKAGKKHVGYVGNFVETTDGENGIITQYDYQQNTYSDQQFCQDVIEELGEQEEKVTVVGDGGYAGMDNVELAKGNNIELVTTALVGAAPSDVHSEFVIDKETRTVGSCPAGHKPKHCTYYEEIDSYRILFKREHCINCLHKEKCKVKFQKKSAAVMLSQKMVDRAKYLKGISSEEYKKIKNMRNGVEGIPSILRRRYNVDDIPVRGYRESKLWYSMKIGAINVVKLIKGLKKRDKDTALANNPGENIVFIGWTVKLHEKILEFISCRKNSVFKRWACDT